MSAKDLPPVAAVSPPRAPTCGGCFKPVDPATSLKRPIFSATQRRSRYTRVLPEPVVMHFCDAKCRQRSDDADALDRCR